MLLPEGHLKVKVNRERSVFRTVYEEDKRQKNLYTTHCFRAVCKCEVFKNNTKFVIISKYHFENVEIKSLWIFPLREVYFWPNCTQEGQQCTQFWPFWVHWVKGKHFLKEQILKSWALLRRAAKIKLAVIFHESIPICLKGSILYFRMYHNFANLFFWIVGKHFLQGNEQVLAKSTELKVLD